MPLVNNHRSSAARGPDDQTVMALLDDLAALDPHLRRGAARRLGAYPQTAASLGCAIGTEAVGSVRESIFTALIRIGTKLAAAGLVPLLQSQDAGLRNGAMEALKTMPEFAAECLGEIFADASDVRIFSVEILGALPSSDRLRWLRRVADDEVEVNVCAVAVDTLVKTGDYEAAPLLLQILKRFPDEPYLEFAVLSALARINDVTARGYDR
jgi:HEAT repeat protein